MTVPTTSRSRSCPAKTELIKRRGPWRGVDHVEIASAESVDWFNYRRPYEYCGDLPPAEMEAAYYAQTRAQQSAELSNRSVSRHAGAISPLGTGEVGLPPAAGAGVGVGLLPLDLRFAAAATAGPGPDRGALVAALRPREGAAGVGMGTTSPRPGRVGRDGRSRSRSSTCSAGCSASRSRSAALATPRREAWSSGPAAAWRPACSAPRLNLVSRLLRRECGRWCRWGRRGQGY